MKHLFLVKSWITYLVAQAVVRHEQLDPADVVLLGVRGFEIRDAQFRVVALPYGPNADEPFPKLMKRARLNFLRTLPRLFRFDRFISRATSGRPFHFYSTNTRQRYNRVITTHRRCHGYSFLESGLISYRTREEIENYYPSRKAKGKDSRYYLGRIGAKSYYAPGYHRVYGVGPLAFPGFDRRVELAAVFGRSSVDGLPGTLADIRNVLIFDGLSAHRIISYQSVVEATRWIFDLFRSEGVTTVHFKFHPAQIFSGEDKKLDAFVRDIAKDVRVERLPDSLILEELAYAAPHVRFYVNLSSTAIYAAQAGCEVLSYARYVAQFEDGFDEIIDANPKIWMQSVRFLPIPGPRVAER